MLFYRLFAFQISSKFYFIFDFIFTYSEPRSATSPIKFKDRGTTFTFSGEGINSGDQKLITHRTETCKTLLEHLNTKRVVQVKAPPFSGKTSLLQLLEQYLFQFKTKCYSISMTLADVNFDFKKYWKDKVTLSIAYYLAY